MERTLEKIVREREKQPIDVMECKRRDISQWTSMNLVCERSEKYKRVVLRKIEMTVWAAMDIQGK